MKAIRYLGVSLACMAFAPAVWSAPSSAEAKECVDRFIAQHLDGQPVDVRINDRYVMPMPLPLRTELPLQLTAVDKETGRTIATASCDPGRGLVQEDERQWQ